MVYMANSATELFVEMVSMVLKAVLRVLEVGYEISIGGYLAAPCSHLDF